MRKSLIACAAAALSFALASPAAADVIVNPDGTGFVGKGDVQEALGWNNHQLQANADAIRFRSVEVERVTTTWTCTSPNGQASVERTNRTTTSTRTVLSTVTRERNQVTGFNLTGFGNTNEVVNPGNPAIGTCANPNWRASEIVEGDPEVLRDGIVVVFGGQETVIG